MRGDRKMTKVQHIRILDNALSGAKRHYFSPNEFYYMLHGIILCAQQDYDIISEDFVEIIKYKNKIAEEIRK